MAGNGFVTVCVDAHGGDFAPQVVLEGCEMALDRDRDLNIILVGSSDIVEPFALEHERCAPQVTTEIIDMGEHPAEAVRRKKDSSIVVGCRLVKEGIADGFFSAGSTGACMAAATLVTGRIKGILRPAIATVLPAPAGKVLLLDCGANADCKPEFLLQFAQMGIAYSQRILGNADPRVGLLNIGSEDTKGNALVKDAHALLSEQLPGFAGNCEGNDIMTASFDIVVCDGFTGNVALKTIEGTSRTLFRALKGAMTSSTVRKLAAGVLKPALVELQTQLSSDTVGGSPLLGVKGACIIGHGSSNAVAIANGIRATADAARADVPGAIAEQVTLTSVAPAAGEQGGVRRCL